MIHHHVCCAVVSIGVMTAFGAHKHTAKYWSEYYTEGPGQGKYLAYPIKFLGVSGTAHLLTAMYSIGILFATEVFYYLSERVTGGDYHEHDYITKTHEHSKSNSIYQDYKPFCIKTELCFRNLISVKTAEIMQDEEGGRLLIASNEGSKIFLSKAASYIVLGPGRDNIFFSLCGAEDKNNQISVVEGFDDQRDKISLSYCGKQNIVPKHLRVIYDIVTNNTILEVANNITVPATMVSFLGHHSLLEDIVFDDL